MNAHSSLVRPQPAAGTAASIALGGSERSRRDNGASFARHLDEHHLPPAKAARAALQDRPDLAGRPFGAIVSLFARHEELPAVDDAAPAEAPASDAPAVEAESDDATAPLAAG